MSERAARIGDKYQGLEINPLTGVESNGGFHPDVRNRIQDLLAKEISSRSGQICERAAVAVWTDNLNLEKPHEFLQSAHIVRSSFTPITERVFKRNNELEPYYQLLTKPSEIPFLGTERVHPNWKPLETMFSEADRLLDANLMQGYQSLGETYHGSGVIDGRIRHVIETGLILARLINDPPPFPKERLVGNIWFSNWVQFDAAMIINSPENTNTTSVPVILSENQNGLSSLVPIEIKVDYRARHTTGPSNRLDNKKKGPLPHHVREMQAKFSRIITEVGREIDLPPAFYVVYLRGTLPNVYHYVPMDVSFLRDWRMGILVAEDKRLIADTNIDGARLVVSTLDRRIAQLDIEREKQINNIYEKLPQGELTQRHFFPIFPEVDDHHNN